MSTVTNELGFGSLASVAWSDMAGTDLTSSQLNAVNADISAGLAISALLLEAIVLATKSGLASFRLNDLGDAFQLTDLNTATPGADDNANDWADFIGRATGSQIPAAAELSLSEWRRVVSELQNYASQQASKRDPVGEGGGIKTSNGNWYINGVEVSLLDAYMSIRVNQVANFDDALNVYIGELTENNRLIKAANEWMTILRTDKPTTDTGTKPVSAADIQAFIDLWGVNPLITFEGRASWNGAAYTLTGFKAVDAQIDNVKGYVDGKDTDNQTVQQKLEQMTNRRSEVLDGLTSFSKSQTQTGAVFARNLG